VSERARRALRFASPAISILAVLGLWQAVAHSGRVPVRLFPDIPQIGAATERFVSSGDFLYHSEFTLYQVLIAFAIAAPCGIVLGTLLARSSLAEALFEPIFAFGYPIPKIALYPLFLFIFGIGSTSKVALATLETLYPVTLGTYYGMRSADRTLIWAARNMGASTWRIFFSVLLPNALPYITSALRIGLHIAFVVIILLEIIGDNSGLGFYLSYQTVSFNYAGFFAGIVGIVFWGFLIDQTMQWLRRRFVFW
jgi:NitT/TauT family transport system permease protein